MTRHELKLSSVFYDAVAIGFKTFEIRKDDRGFRPGDILILKEVNYKDDGIAVYTGRNCEAVVAYILRHEDFPAGIPEGYVVMSIHVAIVNNEGGSTPSMEGFL